MRISFHSGAGRLAAGGFGRRLLQAGCVWVGLAAAGLSVAESPADGETLARELRTARPAERVQVQGMIRLRKADGRRVAVPFTYRLEIHGALWEAVYETPGGSGLPCQRLSVTFSESRAPVYLLSEGPSTNQWGAPRQLTGDASMVPYAGSDFWLADLGLQFLHWPQQRVVHEAKIRMRKSRPCYVLESRNPSAQQGYVRVMSWIDRDTGKPIMAEAYGADGKLAKEFEIGGVTKVDGVYQLKNLEMRDVAADSMTLLEFQYEHKE